MHTWSDHGEISRLPSGQWRVQIRRKGVYASKTFRIKSHATRWADRQEDGFDRGEGISKDERSKETLGDLIDIHMQDMAEVGRAARRSKDCTLSRLKASIGKVRS